MSVEDFESVMDSVGAYVHYRLNYFVLLTLLQLIWDTSHIRSYDEELL